MTVPADLTAARRELDRRLHGGGPERRGARAEDVDRLRLVVEELASNGLRHAGPPVTVQVLVSEQEWLVQVSDHRPEVPPVPAIGRDPAFGGLGLHVVARLSSDHGWTLDGEIKCVWARLSWTVDGG
ncbi:ATP-binding protein [Geodermatophilus normandii]|uniref:ATP-binding protein n=1 Tax=Geodermatophilus normandii TaxID=1137989 RepID=UPI0031F2FA57